jgi:glycosyltransferase involved in cell wall biosynthesis
MPLIAELQRRLGPRLHVEAAEEHQSTRSSSAAFALAQGGSPALQRIEATALPAQVSWFRSSFASQARVGDVFVGAGNPRIISNFRWLARRGVGTVWWGQGWGANTSERSARVRLWLSNLFDVRLFYDETERSLIGKWANEPTFYINNTIDYSEIEQVSIRETPKPAFCFIGRPTAKSGAAMLPAIADGLRAKGLRNLKMGLVGDGTELAALRATIERLGLAGAFEFHGAVFDRSRVSQILQHYSFSIYPGSIGLTTQHALSEGLPLITHRELEGHMPEGRLLRHGFNAFLCERSLDSFIDTCFDAAHLEPAAYREMQYNCLEIRKSHSISKMADAFVLACEAAHSGVLKRRTST